MLNAYNAYSDEVHFIVHVEEDNDIYEYPATFNVL